MSRVLEFWWLGVLILTFLVLNSSLNMINKAGPTGYPMDCLFYSNTVHHRSLNSSNLCLISAVGFGALWIFLPYYSDQCSHGVQFRSIATLRYATFVGYAYKNPEKTMERHSVHW